ncbi:MAG: hypothetical protein AB7P78_10330 [Candidatus Binatia bacterium]
MRVSRASRFGFLGAILCLGALFTGCAVLDVKLTSTPGAVARGEPVTFGVKLTNRSQCPVPEAGAVLLAFIPVDEFFGDIPETTPPEFEPIIDKLRMFFDELCEGGNPDFPTAPDGMSVACSRGEAEIVCQLSSRLSADQRTEGGFTFAALNDHLHCGIEGGAMNCQLRLPFARAHASAAGTTAGFQELTCTGTEELPELGEFGALCFIGSFEEMGNLGPGQMAIGEVALPARGGGVVRNLIFTVADVDAEDLGVCKNSTEPCDREQMNPCPGSECGKGICEGGANPGQGCDEDADCGDQGNCILCAELAQDTFLPVDCTTTVIGLQTAPAVSRSGLLALTAALLICGSLWLHMRRRRRA